MCIPGIAFLGSEIAPYDLDAASQIFQTVGVVDLDLRGQAVQYGEFAVDFFRKEHPVFVQLAFRRNEERLAPAPVFSAQIISLDRDHADADEIPAVKSVEGHVD